MLAVLVTTVASISTESHVVWTAFIQIRSKRIMPTIGRHSIRLCQTAEGLHVSGIKGVLTCAPERCSCINASACDDVEDAWWQLDLMHDGGQFQAGETAHL